MQEGLTRGISSARYLSPQIAEGRGRDELLQLVELLCFCQTANLGGADGGSFVFYPWDLQELDAVLREKPRHALVVLARHPVQRFFSREAHGDMEAGRNLPGKGGDIQRGVDGMLL